MKTILLLLLSLIAVTACSDDAPPANPVGCADEDTLSIGASSDLPEKFTSIRVEPGLCTNTNLQGALNSCADAVTTYMQDFLPRATLLTRSDVFAMMQFATMVQLLGGDDWGDSVVNIISDYDNAPISIALNLNDHAPDRLRLDAVVVDAEKRKSLYASQVVVDTTNADPAFLQTFCQDIAEHIKNARVGMSVTPERAAIDFDNPADRQRPISLEIRNLKNEPVTSGTVTFTPMLPDSGTVSPAAVAVGDGTAATTFTMTARIFNSVAATFTLDDLTMEIQTFITPRCNWILMVEGSKVFSTDHDPNIFCGEGGWISITGASTESGGIALTFENGGNQVAGYGWNSEIHSSTVSGLMKTVFGDISTSAAQSGTAKGGWVLTGTLTDQVLNIQTSLAFGMAGHPGSGGFTTLSFFENASLPLQSGATTTVSGSMPLIGGTDPDAITYTYTLTLRRARQ